MRTVLKHLCELYGRTNVADFRPLSLEAVRNKLIATGNCRGFVNQNMSRLKHVFKWGVSKELVPETVYRRSGHGGGAACWKVCGPRDGSRDADRRCHGRSYASAPSARGGRYGAIATPHWHEAQRSLHHPPVRPGPLRRRLELSTPRTQDGTQGPWPRDSVGAAGRGATRPYLLREAECFCFVPRRRSEENRYTTRSYRAAIHRGCELAFALPRELQGKKRLTPEQNKQAVAWRAQHAWDPNRLRHSAATTIRKMFGLEAAQVVLGHAKPDTTLIYAERDLTKAAEVMREVG